MEPTLKSTVIDKAYRAFSLRDKLKSIVETSQSNQEASFRFDWEFYANYYEDLEVNDSEEAYEHWIIYGQIEERFPNLAVLEEYIEQNKAELPEGFDDQLYLKLNPDLQDKFATNQYRTYKAIEQFLRYGKLEDRPYSYACLQLHELTPFSQSAPAELASQKPCIINQQAFSLYSALFEPARYIENHPDSAKFGINPLVHLIQNNASRIGEATDQESQILDEALTLYQLALQLQPLSPEVVSRSTEILHYRNQLNRANHDLYQCGDEVYALWLAENTPKMSDLRNMGKAVKSLSYKPLISIIVPVYNTPEVFLQETIQSVLAQIYPYWELCIADDRSTEPHVRSILEEYASRDSRIKVLFREENGHISASSNSALKLATGEFIALLDHDDLITPDALYEVAVLLNQHPDADMIYSDEDKLNEQKELISPFFKPDWCPDSFLSRMYTCHLGIYRRSIVEKIGGFRIGYEGSQDYDLVLRFTEQTDKIFHIPKILYHWRIHSNSTAGSAAAKPYAYEAGARAIADAIHRRGEAGEVISNQEFPGAYTVRYKIAKPGCVSIIIPTRNLSHILARCLESIFTKTTYSNYEVIVIDNGSDEPELIKLLASWQRKQPHRFRFYTLNIPFNYSRINNYAATKARGDYLLFLNNDTEIITPDWIEAMIEQSQRPSIGAVGGLLLYPNDSVQHSGILMGVGGIANHGHRGFAANSPGYFSQLVTTNNYSAVTGACLMCRRDLFEQIGGFDEQLTVAYNDVDLCLKMRWHGYNNVYLPHVKLYHHESKSRGYEDCLEKQQRLQQEAKLLQTRWNDYISHDPCYSPNLTRETENYELKIRSNTLIEIVDITIPQHIPSLRGFSVDDLQPGSVYKNFIPIRGWVIGQKGVVDMVEILQDNQLLYRIPIGEPRPDVAQHHPTLPKAEQSGFMKLLRMTNIKAPVKLSLQAVLADQTRVEIGKLQLKPVS